MKVSIITAILNSHEIVRRQYLYYEKMNLPEDVEVVWVDDGSDSPIRFLSGESGKIDLCEDANFNLSIYETHDKLPWTQPKARNIGAKKAAGDYLICTDIDHIVSPEVIDAVEKIRSFIDRYPDVFTLGETTLAEDSIALSGKYAPDLKREEDRRAQRWKRDKC